MLYDDKFFSDRQTMVKDYEWFGFLIKLLFRPKSLIDFGCGNGLLMAPLARRGVNVIGFDYGESAKAHADKIIQDKIYVKDLTKPLIDIPSADLSVCVEVAEHINEIYADVLVGNITNHSTVLVFSAAPPDQGGVGHINLKPWSYWEKKFITKGYKSNFFMTMTLNYLLARRIEVCEWLPKNIHVLKKIEK